MRPPDNKQTVFTIQSILLSLWSDCLRN